MQIAVIGTDKGWQIFSKHFDPTKRVYMHQLTSLSEEYVVFSIGAPIIPKDTLANLRHTFINLHTAPLPSYRGRATDSWMILNGDDGKWHYGCAHFLTEKIDAGPIICLCHYYVKEKAYPIDIFNARIETIPYLVRQSLVLLDMGFKGISQDESRGRYYPPLDTEIDGQIDWTKTVYEVERHVRAFRNPYAGAWMINKGKKVRVLNGEIESGRATPYRKRGKAMKCFYGNYIVTKIKVDGAETWGNEL